MIIEVFSTVDPETKEEYLKHREVEPWEQEETIEFKAKESGSHETVY